MASGQTELAAERAVGALQRVHDEVDRAVRTPPGLIADLLTALVGEGHVLLEDVPGVGKTALARALARAVGVDFSRIQCTPDLLPGDITGVEVFDQRDHQFRFRPGPIFTNLLLVDEANRASPKTQAALLEAMQERQVTADGTSHPIAAPFMVIATQNPIEFEGTFPLPEAQLDRFAMLLSLGYPSREDEARLLAEHAAGDPVAAIAPVADVEELRSAILLARELHVEAAVNEYAVSILGRTRDDPRLALGASPRAGVVMMRMARARALLAGRAYVIPEDVARVAPRVLAHRVVPSADARAAGAAAADVVVDIVARTPLPL
ncbi:MAG: AAA family ATPase [Actinomycetota bacterium]